MEVFIEKRIVSNGASKGRMITPLFLSIDALAAWKDGVKFYHGNEMIWLADSIPANYISTN